MDSSVEVWKATQDVIEVRTALGTRLVKVPATERQLRDSPEAEQWMEADRMAPDVILGVTGTTALSRFRTRGSVRRTSPRCSPTAG